MDMKAKIDINFRRLNHVQICIPPHREAEAKNFYCGLLGLEEIEKPKDLKENGGFWVKIADIELHVGTEDLLNRSKRHPAFEVQRVDQVRKELQQHGIRIKDDRSLPRFHRFSFYDPFDNRIELLEEKSSEELDFLSREVTVHVDRPLQSRHPEYGFVYELNYGYLPDTVGGDGQTIDAYILGEPLSLKTFTGQVKAVIIRYNDQENKLVVTRPDYVLTEQEVRAMTNFQEQYFDTQVRLLE